MNSPGPMLVLVMGVAGCGKSTLAGALAQALACPLIEGDDHHPPENRRKMAQGIALDDSDRAPWLQQLGDLLGRSSAGAVLTCSALKQRYREQLRAAVPGLMTVFVDISPLDARARVAARVGHLFPVELVASQFAALEPPLAEPRTLRVDATHALAVQTRQILEWLGRPPAATPSTTF